MGKGFSFDGALLFPFRAAHARTFPWKFALAMAVIGTVLTTLFLFLARGSFFAFIDQLEALAEADAEDPALIIGTLLGTLGGLVPWLIISSLVSWAIWSMFVTASQRRYLYDEEFSLRFGPDEVRMMGVSFVWFAVQAVVSAIPLAFMMPLFSALVSGGAENMTEDELVRMVFGGIGGVMLSLLVVLPVYAFFATRFSPVFAMTVKEKKIAFRDAWIVSRGRFWPILGAYLIIAIVGGMVVGFAGTMAELVLMPGFMSSPAMMEDVPDFRSLFTPAVMIGVVVYMFIRYFLYGLLMHFVHGPAAFAARHDPRGSIDDQLKVTDFD